MLLFELLTGQRPFESLTTTQELNKAVSQGERPLVAEGNLEPAFPGIENLMYDCWKQSAMERPGADEVHVHVRVHVYVLRLHTHTHTHHRWYNVYVSLASFAASTPSQNQRTILCKRLIRFTPVQFLLTTKKRATKCGPGHARTLRGHHTIFSCLCYF